MQETEFKESAEFKEPENLPHLSLGRPITIDMNSLLFSKPEIVELWEMGVVGAVGYVYMALSYDKKAGQAFDLENFIIRWKGIPDPNTGKTKKLSPKDVMNAVCVLEEKQMIESSVAKTRVELLSLDRPVQQDLFK